VVRLKKDHPGDHQRRDASTHDRQENVESAHVLLAPAIIQKAPAARIDGTHSPTNTPYCRSPANHRVTDSTNDAAAAIRNSITPKRSRCMTPAYASTRALNLANESLASRSAAPDTTCPAASPTFPTDNLNSFS